MILDKVDCWALAKVFTLLTALLVFFGVIFSLFLTLHRLKKYRQIIR